MPNISRVDDSKLRQLLHSGKDYCYFRSCWIVFIHVVRGRPDFQEETVKILACFVWHSINQEIFKVAQVKCKCIHAMWPNREKWHAWIACLSVSPHHSVHGGATWFLAAFSDTTDQKHRSHIYTFVNKYWRKCYNPVTVNGIRHSTQTKLRNRERGFVALHFKQRRYWSPTVQYKQMKISSSFGIKINWLLWRESSGPISTNGTIFMTKLNGNRQMANSEQYTTVEESPNDHIFTRCQLLKMQWHWDTGT